MTEQELKEALLFAIKLANVFNKLRDSHVFFYLQDAYPENEDWEWNDYQELLNRIIALEKLIDAEGVNHE